MLSFVLLVLIWSRIVFTWDPLLVLFWMAFVDACLFLLSVWAFAFVLLLVVVCGSSLPFAFVCLLPYALAVVCIVCYLAVRPQS